jgi:hypothetical protein
MAKKLSRTLAILLVLVGLAGLILSSSDELGYASLSYSIAQTAPLLTSLKTDQIEITVRRFLKDSQNRAGVVRAYFLLFEAKNLQSDTPQPLSATITYSYSTGSGLAQLPPLTQVVQANETSFNYHLAQAHLNNLPPGPVHYQAEIESLGRPYLLAFDDTLPPLPMALNSLIFKLSLGAMLLGVAGLITGLFLVGRRYYNNKHKPV